MRSASDVRLLARHCIHALIAAGGLLVLDPSSAQEDRLDELIPDDRQESLGLHKLTPKEREALLAVFAEIYKAGLDAGKSPSTSSPAAPRQPASSVIESKIDGDFEGWEGETVVKLTNGQIWQQTEYYYHYHYAYGPDVLIYNSGGGYKMKVEGVDRPVGVQRLR